MLNMYVYGKGEGVGGKFDCQGERKRQQGPFVCQLLKRERCYSLYTSLPIGLRKKEISCSCSLEACLYQVKVFWVALVVEDQFPPRAIESASETFFCGNYFSAVKYKKEGDRAGVQSAIISSPSPSHLYRVQEKVLPKEAWRRETRTFGPNEREQEKAFRLTFWARVHTQSRK